VLKIARLAEKRSTVHGRKESVNALPNGPHFPPTTHGPMGACTHNSINVQVARAWTSNDQRCTRTPRLPAGKQDTTSVPATGRAFRHAIDGVGSGIGQTPGDHATNLGATMLVPLRMTPLASSLGKLGTQCI
jgi:hypothetical protein